jgi:hypothetical protein
MKRLIFILVLCAVWSVGCVVVLGQGMGEISVKWDANTESDLKGYHIRVDDTLIDVGNVTQYRITGLDVGTTYSITVDAHDTEDNESLESEAVSGIAKNVQAPAQPTGLIEE